MLGVEIKSGGVFEPIRSPHNWILLKLKWCVFLLPFFAEVKTFSFSARVQSQFDNNSVFHTVFCLFAVDVCVCVVYGVGRVGDVRVVVVVVMLMLHGTYKIKRYTAF